jgi:hypothetical protein
MGFSFELQVSATGVVVKFACQSAFDVARSRVVALDKVAVVGVHDPDEACEVRRRRSVESEAQSTRGRRKLSR